MTSPLRERPARPAAARRATAAVFFANGAGFGIWAAHIPLLKKGLDLSEGELGLALLMMAAGAVATMPLVGRWAVRAGSRPTVAAAGFAFAALLAVPPLAPGLGTLMLACLLLGAANGALDVAMNTHATAVERAWRRPIMSGFHAFYSLGGLAGAGAAGAAIAGGFGPAATMTAAAAALVLAVGAANLHLAVATPPAVPGAGFARPRRPVLRLGILAVLGFFAEGSLIDWCAVYLVERVGTSPAAGASGYAAFSLAMTAGRLTGDRIAARFGPQRTLAGSAALAAAGLALAIAVPHPVFAPAGFAVAGLGLANIVPLLFGQAARVPGVAPGAGVAMVAVFGYAGALAGPPLIGFAAEGIGLRAALGTLVAAAVLGGLLIPWAIGRDRRR
ncbi:MFS transporter [Allostella vacuolata]|nr:MFS transporter [Stella vacuolata]